MSEIWNNNIYVVGREDDQKVYSSLLLAEKDLLSRIRAKASVYINQICRHWSIINIQVDTNAKNIIKYEVRCDINENKAFLFITNTSNYQNFEILETFNISLIHPTNILKTNKAKIMRKKNKAS